MDLHFRLPRASTFAPVTALTVIFISSFSPCSAATKVRLGQPVVAMQYAPLYFGVKRGIFATKVYSGGATMRRFAIAALGTGDVDYINMAFAWRAPRRVSPVGLPRPQDTLLAGRSAANQSARDLQVIAYSRATRRKSFSRFAAAGVNPKRRLTFQVVFAHAQGLLAAPGCCTAPSFNGWQPSKVDHVTFWPVRT
jgi:hypothetical protein